MIIYDDDRVDEVNLGGQMYCKEDIGTKKAEGTIETAREFSFYEDIVNMEKKYVKGDPLSEIVICCPDNMETRKTAFEQWRKLPNKKVFMDIRMTMEDYFIFTVIDEKDEKDYEQELFPSSEAEELQCNTRATSHCGAMAAARAVSLVTNYAAKDREVPFKIHECLPIVALL